ncbi:helix-turn-helix domain-containing protein [Amycolatopsis rubida]|uniref:Helix-turn-helix domain-containing protein n=1 Tax=Amycolatopsis rubida TaxID=112413 RepID=A0ABX0BZT4_9PSEU|nr:helix-turn-helix transcriptional regulator [Amycolatopsis sp. M39]MYW96108.1 helix-turn-helix domain-containing protein [Amycolatopsis rubida]NEC61099.1 helix-turn-helix domain-containing protein [Amycolatopsis rubida]OAP23380.1 hypothetical protein A4R44_06027 [Amycolatopsis sp. M39]
MDYQSEIRDFLTSRRARLSPEEAGVPVYRGVRRVPGLRREEVAHLAGVSVDYYVRLERGRVKGVSQEVLDAVARALQFDDVEYEHLMDLVRNASPRSGRVAAAKVPVRQPVRPGVQSVLDSLTVPAFVQNGRHDMLAANQVGRALYPFSPDDERPFNHARFMFLDPRAEQFYVDWDLAAANNVALLRSSAAKDPDDEALINLVGLLSTQSEAFRSRWAAHDVIKYRYGPKRYRHPLVGDLTFGYESFPLPDSPGLVMLVYTVEAASPTHDALQLLASWTASETPASAPSDADVRGQ